MQSIKITQKSLDAFKKEKALVPALLDEKDITTDWIQDVFDDYSCVWGARKSAVGYVCEQPVLVAWSDNDLLWKFMEQNTIEHSNFLAVLKDRLSIYDENEGLVIKSKVIGNLYWQKFYWEDED